jgi:hypothetical protein
MQWKMDMTFRTWNVTSLYRACSLKTVSSELAKCKLDVMAKSMTEVRWDKGGSQPVDDYTFFYGNGKLNHHLG